MVYECYKLMCTINSPKQWYLSKRKDLETFTNRVYDVFDTEILNV